jgi:hypothetical protein
MFDILDLFLLKALAVSVFLPRSTYRKWFYPCYGSVVRNRTVEYNSNFRNNIKGNRLTKTKTKTKTSIGKNSLEESEKSQRILSIVENITKPMIIQHVILIIPPATETKNNDNTYNHGDDPFSNWPDLIHKAVYSIDGKTLAYLEKSIQIIW